MGKCANDGGCVDASAFLIRESVMDALDANTQVCVR